MEYFQIREAELRAHHHNMMNNNTGSTRRSKSKSTEDMNVGECYRKYNNIKKFYCVYSVKS